MPIISLSSYQPASVFSNGHLQSIYPFYFRKIKNVNYQRERINTLDDDFLDLDWSKVGSDSLVVISHGLEGSSQSQYVLGMTRTLNAAQFDVLAWNYRGCSGEPNQKLNSYHSGKFEDLETVIQYVVKNFSYKKVFLVGFSVGGNITLQYLAKRNQEIPDCIRKAVTFSVPCDLASSAKVLSAWPRIYYTKHFLKLLSEKIRIKANIYPGRLDLQGIEKLRTFQEFDDRYTAPLNGFRDAEHYWSEASSVNNLKLINVPTLLVNAANDPFLGPECYPREVAQKSESLFLEIPDTGGHVGFISNNGVYWYEKRAVEFIRN